ncbi:hypothetical protein Fcan01_18102 [Folsomia candida]|uniref:Uncharacterized protein n=1 Tax=Folsomia candida TaxID=158441 RepID=A0A226DP82_FOLCA|nr:hypothetical protein Fcan01_18102 [Folsomia candida]
MSRSSSQETEIVNDGARGVKGFENPNARKEDFFATCKFLVVRKQREDLYRFYQFVREEDGILTHSFPGYVTKIQIAVRFTGFESQIQLGGPSHHLIWSLALHEDQAAVATRRKVTQYGQTIDRNSPETSVQRAMLQHNTYRASAGSVFDPSRPRASSSSLSAAAAVTTTTTSEGRGRGNVNSSRGQQTQQGSRGGGGRGSSSTRTNCGFGN